MCVFLLGRGDPGREGGKSTKHIIISKSNSFLFLTFSLRRRKFAPLNLWFPKSWLMPLPWYDCQDLEGGGGELKIGQKIKC